MPGRRYRMCLGGKTNGTVWIGGNGKRWIDVSWMV